VTTYFNPNEEAVARRSSVTELCAAWETAQGEIRDAFHLVLSAQNRLNLFFDDGRTYYGMDVLGGRHQRSTVDLAKPEETLTELARQVWQNLVGRLELRKLMSLKRIAELDKQLETGAGLPPINVQNVLALLETTLNSAGQMLDEKVLECYEKLRPRGWTLTEYKTNQKSAAAGVGRKVIMGYMIRRSYGQKGNFEVEYGRSQDELRALDQVFHLLDGKPWKESSWAGELCDAIRDQTGVGKNDFATTYFKGRCFGNRNLHLEFTRADLVAKFNLIAGGARLQGGTP
jgi:hypothetical protein